MKWQSILAIYVLFWMFSVFLILPFEARDKGNQESAEVIQVPGQADGAPSNFRPWRVVERTTILASLFFGLFYANYVNGWITTGAFE